MRRIKENKMKPVKLLGLAAVAAMALVPLGADSASAETLYKYTTPSANDVIALGTTLTASLESGTSLVIKDTNNFSVDTCTASHLSIKVETNNNTDAGGKVNEWSLGAASKPCSHTTHVISNGELEIKQIAGTTNGTVISKNARVTIQSTIFGVSCLWETGAGTVLGTLTGAKSPTGHATIDINAVVPFNPGGDSTWTGSYTVTSPTGLTVD